MSLLVLSSFGIGLCIAFIPAFIFAKIFFKKTGASAAKEIVLSFYLGETLKLILTALLFLIAFCFGKPDALSLFLGFILGQVISVAVSAFSSHLLFKLKTGVN